MGKRYSNPNMKRNDVELKLLLLGFKQDYAFDGSRKSGRFTLKIGERLHIEVMLSRRDFSIYTTPLPAYLYGDTKKHKFKRDWKAGFEALKRLLDEHSTGY